MSDIKSHMKTFTVRQMHRQGAAVLKACDRDGVVRIRHRDGRVYTLKPESGPLRMQNLPNFSDRIAKTFPKRIPAKQVRLVDRLIAGE